MGQKVLGNLLLFRLIWPPAPKPGKKHTLVERLTELREAHHTVLADEEYAAFRSTILGELATLPRIPISWLTTLLVSCLVAAALLGYSIYSGRPGLGFSATGGLAGGLLIWFRLARDYAAKRALGREDQLEALKELVSKDLVSSEKAISLRARIEDLSINGTSPNR
jgi:hypothetical protein